MADLGFLRPSEQRTVAMALAALACATAGFFVRGAVSEARASNASQVDQVAADVAELKTNMARVMDRLGIAAAPSLPVRASGAGR